MNIGYVILGGKLHGAEKRVFKIALSEWFEKGDHNSYLIINKKLYNLSILDQDLKRKVKYNKDKIIILPNFLEKKWGLLLFLIITAYYIYIKKINIVHTYLNARNKVALLSIMGIKVVFEITSPDIADLFVSHFRNRYYIYKHLRKVNCVSKSVYDRIVNNTKHNVKGLINLDYISIPFTKVNAGEFRIDKKEKTIIYASRFIERKNVLSFSIGMNNVLREFPSWKLKIFGSGPLESKIRTVLKKYLNTGQVIIGYTNDILEEFKKSSIVCSLIYPDNYPSQSLFEAMACGNALVVSNDGMSSIFIKGGNGILTDRNKFEYDICNLISNKNELKEMQKNSIKYYKSKFSIDNYFIELFEKCYK